MSPSPIRCRGPWKIQKRSSEPDRWLDDMDFYRKHTARDSSCLFRAVSENIFNTQHYYQKVRLQCIEFMSSNRHLFEGSLSCSFENYLKEMSNASAWGGIVELSAMSHLYRRDFTILEANKGPQTNICNGYGKTIYLFYSPDTKHFDALYRKEFINNSAFCQSLLMFALIYELLYDRVYHLEDLYYAVDKMLHEKVTTNHIEYMMPDVEHKKQKERAKIFIEETNAKDNNSNALSLKCKHHTNDIEKASLLKESLSIFVFNRSLIQLENVCLNCLNVNSAKVLLDNGITPFPYKVAKALDPDIYRNIEFDVWSELRRELRFGARYSDGTTLQVGVKCLCKLEVDQDVPYHCHIQEMGQDGGPCLVFIEELGEKRLVNYEQLEPLPMDEIKPWAPPYRYSRANSQLLNLSQMLQQIGTVIRKQGIKSSKKSRNDDTRMSEKETKLDWTEEKAEITYEAYNYPPYQHSDICNFQPMPVEIETVPLMVDIRAAGAPPQEANGSSPDIHNQAGGAGDMGNQATPTPVSVRASTPATTNSLTTYSGVNPGSGPPLGTTMPANVPYNCGQYMCGMKSVVWCSPHSPPQPLAPGMPMGGMGINVPHPPPPLPPGVNPHVFKSVQANGSDLPMNDIATLRYFFNLGVECMWAAYGPPLPPPPHPPHPMHPPPRHYSPSTLAQDMQQLAVQDRPPHGDPNHNKHKQDKNTNIQGKGNNVQRPLLGPRFKRGNNQDNNQSHNQNKGHNNQGHMNNKGQNNRRNSYVETRGGFVGEEVGGAEAPLLAFPYAPYPPPIYPVPYYHIDDPSMMGMMGGMGGMGYVYEEGMEFSVQPMYGAPPPYPQMHPAAPPPVHEHK